MSIIFNYPMIAHDKEVYFCLSMKSLNISILQYHDIIIKCDLIISKI